MAEPFFGSLKLECTDDGLYATREEAKQDVYTLADEYVLELVRNALDHACEEHPQALEDA